MEEGTSTLQLAFEMAKQGLEDIISVVEVLDHDVVAVSKAKQGLQEIAAAVDVLHLDALSARKKDDEQELCAERGSVDEVVMDQTASESNIRQEMCSVDLEESASCASPWQPVGECDSPWEPVSPKKKQFFALPKASPRSESTKSGDSSRGSSRSSDSSDSANCRSNRIR